MVELRDINTLKLVLELEWREYVKGTYLTEEEFKKRVDKFFDLIYKEASAQGGLVSGEHGIGSGKIQYLVESIGETNMALMEGIKRVFDPKMILNPGKVCYRL